MAVILKKLWAAYDLVTEELPDPRTKNWPLVFKPLEGLPIVAVYILFVLKWGPKWMEDRPPHNLKKLLILHNILQVAVCAYIFYECLIYAWIWDYRWFCEPIDFSDNPKSIRVARFVHHYYLSKYLDLLDTVFFVLRKKSNQVSFLHVYHHSYMLILTWGGVTYVPGGHGTFVVLVNTFVHVVMYSYYLLTTLRPSKRSLWWKKYLTQLQIVQLTTICLHLSSLLVVPNCPYSSWIATAMLPSNFFILYLFVDFYIRTYVRNKNNANRIKANGINTTERMNNDDSEESEGIKVSELDPSALRQRSL